MSDLEVGKVSELIVYGRAEVGSSSSSWSSSLEWPSAAEESLVRVPALVLLLPPLLVPAVSAAAKVAEGRSLVVSAAVVGGLVRGRGKVAAAAAERTAAEAAAEAAVVLEAPLVRVGRGAAVVGAVVAVFVADEKERRICLRTSGELFSACFLTLRRRP